MNRFSAALVALACACLVACSDESASSAPGDSSGSSSTGPGATSGEGGAADGPGPGGADGAGGGAGPSSGGGEGGATGLGGSGAGGDRGAGGSGGAGPGGGAASCDGTLDPALRQTSGDIHAGFATHFIDMTRYRNIGEATFPDLADNEFPGRNGNTWVPFVQNGRFIAFAFEADDVERLAQSIVFAETTVVPSTLFSVSISECPGDFRPALDDAGCMKFGGMGTIPYSVHPTDDSPGACMIRPGRTYYFNIVYRDPSGAETCVDGDEVVPYCGNLFTTYG